MEGAGRAVLSLPFQYPRSDRAHCNSGRDWPPPWTPWRFQYPRSDRAHCNPGDLLRLADRAGSFSILDRIEPTATRPGPQPGPPAPDLSVSSVGSSPLQRPDPVRAVWLSVGFQYPRSDRAHCNHALDPRRAGRIGAFQYPRSDRAHCNVAAQWPTRVGEEVFQYPRSDRAHCNRRICLRDAGPIFLSVSSVGSSSLQLGTDSLRVAVLWDLSVSSVGSSSLQLPASALAGVQEPRLFQYPRSDRAHCNSHRDGTRE